MRSPTGLQSRRLVAVVVSLSLCSAAVGTVAGTGPVGVANGQTAAHARSDVARVDGSPARARLDRRGRIDPNATHPTVSPRSVTARSGTIIRVPIVLDEAPRGVTVLQGINVSVDDPGVAAPVAVERGAFPASQTVVTERGPGHVVFGVSDIAFGRVQPGAENVTLGYVVLNATGVGETTLDVSVGLTMDDARDPIDPALEGGTVTVERTTGDGQRHVLGGQRREGALRVTVDAGQPLVELWTGTRWRRQYCTYAGAVVVVDGTAYGLGYYDDRDGTASGSRGRLNRTGTVVGLHWTVVDRGDERVRDVRLLRGADAFLAGEDRGVGFWTPETTTVGVRRRVAGAEQRLSFRSVPPPPGCESRHYAAVSRSVQSGSLSNATADRALTDDGYALAWRHPSLAPDGRWTVEASETVDWNGIGPAVRGGDSAQLDGGSARLAFELRNDGASSSRIKYAVDCPSGWDCPLPGSVVLGPGNATDLTVRATPPSTVANGTYVVRLVARANGPTAAASGRVVIA